MSFKAGRVGSGGWRGLQGQGHSQVWGAGPLSVANEEPWKVSARREWSGPVCQLDTVH